MGTRVRVIEVRASGKGVLVGLFWYTPYYVRTYLRVYCIILMLFELRVATINVRKAWERAKVSLQSVDESCRIDLSELSRMPLEVEMESMDNGRKLGNRGGEVRAWRSGFLVLEGILLFGVSCHQTHVGLRTRPLVP